MSIECGECEMDLRGPHDPSCSRSREGRSMADRRRIIFVSDNAHSSCIHCASSKGVNHCSRLRYCATHRCPVLLNETCAQVAPC